MGLQAQHQNQWDRDCDNRFPHVHHSLEGQMLAVGLQSDDYNCCTSKEQEGAADRQREHWGPVVQEHGGQAPAFLSE